MENYSFLQLLGAALSAISAYYLVSYAVAAGMISPSVMKAIDPAKVFKATCLAMTLGAILFLFGCASLSDPAKPRTQAEMFPVRNQDPRVGLIVNTGTAPSNLFIYDQANRLIEQIYMSGAERHVVSQNGQPYPQYWPRRLEPGCYRVEVFPFYHSVHWTAMAMVRIDLPKQIYSICVGNNPTAVYYNGSNWGWLLYTGTNIPEGGDGLPLFQVSFPR